MSEVLFVCTGNAARSQFAEAIYRQKFGTSVESAGTEVILEKPLPADVLKVLQEEGLSSEGLRRKQLNVNLVAMSKKLILMTESSLPSYLDQARHLIFWHINDPRDEGIEAHRKAFHEISDAIDVEFGTLYK